LEQTAFTKTARDKQSYVNGIAGADRTQGFCLHNLDVYNHVLQAEDTLGNIALRHDMSLLQLKKANNIKGDWCVLNLFLIFIFKASLRRKHSEGQKLFVKPCSKKCCT
jgi:LysM repeat protein